MVSGYDNLDGLLLRCNEVSLDRELAKRYLKDFVDMAWPIVEPSRDYIPNWHTDAICDHLQAVYEGDIRRLVINVPPGSMKSLSCCVFFPAWVWTQDPRKKFIFSGFGDSVVLRDSRRNRNLIRSDWYQERWGDKYKILPGEDTANRYANDAGGFRKSATVKGIVTGEHADIQMTDDPLKPLEVTKSLAVAQTALDEVLTWWNETMSSRLVDLATSARIIIMQRLVDNDLAGEMLKTGDYEHLMLPMEFEPKRKCFTCIGFEDPRTEEKELLCEERFPREAVDKLKKELGSRGAQAQLQQNPVSAEGSIIKREWAVFYNVLPKRFNLMIQSWDCAFKDDDTSDFVVGQVWGVVKEDYYLIDQIRGRMDFVDTCKAVKSMTTKYPKARYKIVEDKANGPAVISELKRKISGLIAVNPEGGKIARVHAVEPIWESGNVFLPTPELAPWIDGEDSFLEEVTGFPARAHDDQVDAMSQALIWLQNKQLGRLRAAMRNVA
jgi:predicted phage terminase large subunit-like protein